jgi:pimeloyl-ACP methyl ester carboxylesterase
MPSKTILFVHGMYMTPLCWEHWLDYFQEKGYRCIAPAWPERDKPVRTLRMNHPDSRLASLTLSQVIEHYSSLIQKLEEKPILIGHSMGGLVVQLLLQRNEALAGIAIDSAPPRGVFTTQKVFLQSNWPHINPFASKAVPIQMTLERFQFTFVNDLPLEIQQAAFERYVVPESRRVPAEALTKTATIDFHSPHAPLLLVAGSNDHLIPAALNQSNFNMYRRSPSVTDFKEFAGRTHFIIGQPGWEEVAGYIAAWLEEKGV